MSPVTAASASRRTGLGLTAGASAAGSEEGVDERRNRRPLGQHDESAEQPHDDDDRQQPELLAGTHEGPQLDDERHGDTRSTLTTRRVGRRALNEASETPPPAPYHAPARRAQAATLRLAPCDDPALLRHGRARPGHLVPLPAAGGDARIKSGHDALGFAAGVIRGRSAHRALE